ncbi:hypothetical protein JKP88DRAFT_272684 [Tribonema minus]|uniref:Uncharacterized protein n=1 Tax=Tribonema minus TaxID=303371 RepID=A0A836CIF8_9STRA|nr:hypothetical protein JKP88DRAFT_272684 [Tribonema minus]
MTVSEYSSELIKFASHLPQYLYDFANVLLAKVREIAAEVYVRLQNVAAIAKQKMAEVFHSLKNVVLDTWETVYDKVINPVMAALMKYVLEPVTELMSKIIAFAKMIIGGVSDMLDKGGKIVSKAYDAVYNAGEALSESIEFVMKKTAHIIENVVDGIRTGLNKGLEEVVGAAETTVNTLSNSVGTIVAGIETGINTTIHGTLNTVEKGVNSVGKGIDNVVGDVQVGINTGLTKMADVAQKGIDGVTNGVEEGVNTLGEVIVGGLGDVLDETEKIVNDLGNVLEDTVNDTIGLINTGLISPIETTINASADVVQSALNGIMVPVRSITGALDKIGSVHINLKPIYDGRPFSFLSAIDVPPVPRIGKLDIADIKNISIKDANVPGIRYVRPKGANPLGRQRLQASIEKAQKNWNVSIKKPNLSVSLNVDPVVIPKPPKNPVNLKAPTVNFDVEIDSKVPKKIYSGVMVAVKRGWQGVKEIASIVYNEVILPFVDVLWFLKDKIVWMIKEFASLTMGFLKDIVKGVQDLGEAVWTKLIDKIPGMSLLPATSTTKLYMVLVVLVLFLVGYQVKFVKDFISGFLRIALVPVIEVDKAFDKYVRSHVAVDSAVAKSGNVYKQKLSPQSGKGCNWKLRPQSG